MLTVPEAASRAHKSPETIRRWIRKGKLPARKVGTQHLIDEADLLAACEEAQLPLPPWLARTSHGGPMPDVVAAVRRSRQAR